MFSQSLKVLHLIVFIPDKASVFNSDHNVISPSIKSSLVMEKSV